MKQEVRCAADFGCEQWFTLLHAALLSLPHFRLLKVLGEDEKDRRQARPDPQLAVDILQVLLYRPAAHAEDESDLGIGLALGYPAEHLGLSRGEGQEPAKRRLSQHPGIRHPLRPALLTPFDLSSAQWEAGVVPVPPFHRTTRTSL